MLYLGMIGWQEVIWFLAVAGCFGAIAYRLLLSPAQGPRVAAALATIFLAIFWMATVSIASKSPILASSKDYQHRPSMTANEIAVDIASRNQAILQQHETAIRSSRILQFALPVAAAFGIGIGFIAARPRVSKSALHSRRGMAILSDVQGFVDMLAAACEDAGMQGTLEKLLSLPDAQRKELLAQIIQEMRERRAPKDIVDAFICLQDDAIAEKAYEAVYKCPRGVPISPLQPLRTAA